MQDGTLVWPSGADICPSVLRYWCKLGRVCSQEELDAHFSAAASAEIVEAVAELPMPTPKLNAVELLDSNANQATIIARLNELIGD